MTYDSLTTDSVTLEEVMLTLGGYSSTRTLKKALVKKGASSFKWGRTTRILKSELNKLFPGQASLYPANEHIEMKSHPVRVKTGASSILRQKMREAVYGS